MNAHLLWSDPDADLAQLTASGVRHVRTDFAWALIEPVEGQLNWKQADRLMASAARYGVEILPILSYSTSWSSSAPDQDFHAEPRDHEQYAGFAAAVVSRYGPSGTFWAGRSESSFQPIRAVELWNEPWGHWFWNPEPDLAAYAAMATLTVERLRTADPEVRIALAGDLLEYRTAGQRPWLERMLADHFDLIESIDVLSIHPYNDPPSLPPWTSAGVDPRYHFKGRLSMTRDLLADHGLADTAVWVTEMGWCAGAHAYCVDEETQASYMAYSLNHIVTEHSSMVERVYVFTWNRTANTSEDWTWNFGMRRLDGTTRPAWSVVRSFAGG